MSDRPDPDHTTMDPSGDRMDPDVGSEFGRTDLGSASASTIPLPVASQSASIARPASVHDGATDQTPRVPRDPRARLVLVTLLFAVVAFGLNILSISNAVRLSAFDESTHIDYAYRLSHGELPQLGQQLTPYTLESWSCRGQANLRKPPPPCGSHASADSYPAHGIQYNASHPPLYYAIAGIGGRLMAAITGQDFVTMARAMGGIFLFLGMMALYLTLRYWHVAWTWAVGGAMLLPLIPVVLHATSSVTNDAAIPLAGAAALFVLGRYVVYRNDGWAIPLVLTVLVTATKTISAVALGAVGIVFVVMGIVRWRRHGRSSGISLVRNGAIMGIALGLVHFCWQAFQLRRAIPDYISPISGVHTRKIVGLPFDEWASTLFGGARLGDDFYLDPLVSNAYLVGWVALISTIFGAAGFVGLALFERGSARWIASGTLLIGLLLYPLAVQLQTVLHGNYFFDLSTRYGMSLIPVAIGVVVFVAERKRLRATSWVLLLAGGSAVCSATLGVLR